MRPTGDPLLEDEQFYGEERGRVPPHPADVEPAAEAESVPAPRPADPAPAPAQREPYTHVDQETEEYELEPDRKPTTTSSRPHRNFSRTHQSTTGSGSNSVPRAISTSTADS